MNYPTWKEVTEAQSWQNLTPEQQTIVRVSWMDTVKKNNPDATKQQLADIWKATNPRRDQEIVQRSKQKRQQTQQEQEVVAPQPQPQPPQQPQRQAQQEAQQQAPVAPIVQPTPKPQPQPIQMGGYSLPIYGGQTDAWKTSQVAPQPEPVKPPVDWGKVTKTAGMEVAKRSGIVQAGVAGIEGYKQGGLTGAISGVAGSIAGRPIRKAQQLGEDISVASQQKAIGSDWLKSVVGKKYEEQVPTTYGDWINRGIGVLASPNAAVLGGIQEGVNAKRNTVWWEQSEKDRVRDIKDTIDNVGWRATIPSPVPIDFRLPDNLYDMIQTQAQNGLTPEEIDKKIMQDVKKGRFTKENTPKVVGRNTPFGMEDFFSPAGAIQAFLMSAGKGEYKTVSDLRKDFLGQSYEERLGTMRGMATSIAGDMLTDPLVVTQLPRQLAEGILNAVNKAKHIRNLKVAYAYMKLADDQMKAYASKEALKRWKDQNLPNRINLLKDAIKEAKERQGKGWEIVRRKLPLQEERKALPPAKEKLALKEGKPIEIAETGTGPTRYNVEGRTVTNVIPAGSADAGAIARAAREGKFTEGVLVRKGLPAAPERRALPPGTEGERKAITGRPEPKALPPHPAVPLGPIGSTTYGATDVTATKGGTKVTTKGTKVGTGVSNKGKKVTDKLTISGGKTGMAIEETTPVTTAVDPVSKAKQFIKDAGFEADARVEKAANGKTEISFTDPRTGSTMSVFAEDVGDSKAVSDMATKSYDDKLVKYNDALKFMGVEDVTVTKLSGKGYTIDLKHSKSGKTGTLKLDPDAGTEANRETIKKWIKENAAEEKPVAPVVKKEEPVKPQVKTTTKTEFLSTGKSKALPQAVHDELKKKVQGGMTVYRGKGKSPADPGDFGVGAYHSSNKAVAEQYGDVTKKTISLRNPLVLNDKEAYALADQFGTVSGKPGYATGAGPIESRLEASKRMTETIMKKGHDGVVVLHPDGTVEVVDYTALKIKKKKVAISTPEVKTTEDFLAKQRASAVRREEDLKQLEQYLKEGKQKIEDYHEPTADDVIMKRSYKEALAKETSEAGLTADDIDDIRKSQSFSPLDPEDIKKEQFAEWEARLKKYGFDSPSDARNVKKGEFDPTEGPEDTGYYLGSLFGGLQKFFDRRALKRAGAIEDGMEHWRKPTFSVLKPWEILGKKRVGYAIKDIYSVDDAFQQEGVNWMGKIAKAGGVGRYAVLNRGKGAMRWNMEDMSEIVLSANNEERWARLNPEQRERIKDGVKIARDYFAWARNWYQKHGVNIDFKQKLLDMNMEQLGAIQKIASDMKASPTVQYWEKAILSANGLQVPAGFPKELSRQQMAKFLRMSYDENVAMAKELEKFRYIHIPYDMWFESGKSMDRAATLKALRIANAHKRKTLFIEDLIQAGAIKKEDVNIFDVIASYTHRLGKDMGLLNVKKIALEEGLLSKTKTAGGPGKLPGFERMPAWQAPMFQDTWMHPAFREWLTDFRYQTYNQNMLDKGFSMAKMWQFVQPLFLPYYDVVQSSLSLAFSNPFKVAKSVYNAGRMMLTKSPEYYEHLRLGLSSQPVSPPWSQMADTLERMKSPTFGAYIKNAMKNKNWTVIKPIYNVLWETAWWGDRLIRLASTDYMVKNLGMSKFSANQLAALFFSDYANVPIATRRALNKVFFTPTYKITMGRLFKEQVKGFARTAYNLTTGKKVTREDKQLAKSLIWGVGGLLFGWDQLMTRGLGYTRDQFGRRYYKLEDDPDKPGSKREHTVVFSNPMNLIPKYFYMARDIWNKAEHDDRWAAITNALRWEIHPIWRVMTDVAMNRKANGEPIVEPFEYDDWTARAIKTRYAFKEILRLADAVLADPESEKNKQALEQYRKDAGNLWYYINEPATFSYYRISKADAAYKRINKLQSDYSKGIKSMEERGILTPEKELGMIKNYYNKYDMELNHLIDAVKEEDNKQEEMLLEMEKKMLPHQQKLEEKVQKFRSKIVEPAPLSVPGATIKK